MQKLVQLVREEEGQSLVEYGLILGIVSVALITVLGAMRTELGKIFDTVSKSLKSASSGVGRGN
jgi:pilus assembly protein Flp/PilA